MNQPRWRRRDGAGFVPDPGRRWRPCPDLFRTSAGRPKTLPPAHLGRGAITLFTTLVVLLPGVARAQADAPADTMRLTLDDAIAWALEVSPGLAATAALQREADAAVWGARAAGLPALDLSAGYGRYSDVPEFAIALPGGSEVAISPNLPEAWRARVAASLPIYTGGRVSAATGAARWERQAAADDLLHARADLKLEVIAAYWNLFTLRESASVLGEALAAYESHLEDARHRAQVGLAARSEVLAVTVERDRAELGRVQAAGAAAAAEENLRRLLAVSDRTVIELASQPAIVPAGAPSARERGETGTDAVSLIDSLVALALTNRPDRTALAARVEAARARIRSERGARRPQLAAIAGYDYANPNRRFTPAQAEWKGTWDASLNLTLPLFDSGRISAATARAQARAEAIQAQESDLEQRIRLEVALRLIERRTAETAVGVSERALDSAREDERVTRDRYREGVADSSELLDAETRRLRAALDHTEAQARLRLAQANLERAVGGPR